MFYNHSTTTTTTAAAATMHQLHRTIDYNKSIEWLKLISQQIVYNNNGKLVIELDHNDANLTLSSAQFVLNMFKKNIASQTKKIEIVFIVLYVLIILFGTVTNSLMIFAFWRSEKLKTIRNTFIINLAISDILLCSICAPLTVLRVFSSKWYSIGNLLCKLGPGLQTANVLASAFSITAIAADRYQFIVYPGNDTTRKLGAFGCSLILWLIAFLLSIPSFIVNNVTVIKWKHTNQIVHSICQETWIHVTYKYLYCIFVFTIHFMLPFLIICITNFQICLFLEYHVPSIYTISKRKSQVLINSLSERTTRVTASQIFNSELPHAPPQSHAQSHTHLHRPLERQESIQRNSTVSINYEQNSLIADHKRYNHIKRLLLIVALSFALCWLPLDVLNLIADINWKRIHDGEQFTIIFLTFHLLAMTSSCVNPLLYGILNTNFKEELLSIVNAKSVNQTLKSKANNHNLPRVAVNLYNELDNDAGTFTNNYGTTTKSSRLISKTSLANTIEDERSSSVFNFKNRNKTGSGSNNSTVASSLIHRSLSTEFFKPRPYYSIYKIDEESSNHINSSLLLSKRNSISNSELNTLGDKSSSYIEKLLSPNYVFSFHASLRKKSDGAVKQLTSTNTSPIPIHRSCSESSIVIKDPTATAMVPEIVITAYSEEESCVYKYVDSDSDCLE